MTKIQRQEICAKLVTETLMKLRIQKVCGLSPKKNKKNI